MIRLNSLVSKYDRAIDFFSRDLELKPASRRKAVIELIVRDAKDMKIVQNALLNYARKSKLNVLDALGVLITVANDPKYGNRPLTPEFLKAVLEDVGKKETRAKKRAPVDLRPLGGEEGELEGGFSATEQSEDPSARETFDRLDTWNVEEGRAFLEGYGLDFDMATRILDNLKDTKEDDNVLALSYGLTKGQIEIVRSFLDLYLSSMDRLGDPKKIADHLSELEDLMD